MIDHFDWWRILPVLPVLAALVIGLIEFIDRYYASEPERAKRRTEVEQLSAEALSRYKARFQPLYDIVVAKFDYWIEGVKKRGVDVSLRITDAVVVGGAEVRNSGGTVRTAKFGNGAELLLQIFPVVVEDGRVVQNLHFQMPFFKGGASFGEVWAMTVEEKEWAATFFG